MQALIPHSNAPSLLPAPVVLSNRRRHPTVFSHGFVYPSRPSSEVVIRCRGFSEVCIATRLFASQVSPLSCLVPISLFVIITRLVADDYTVAFAAEIHDSSQYMCSNVAQYYQGTSGLNGNALRKKLHQIIENQHVVPYNQTWDALKVLDSADLLNPEASFDIIEIYSQKAVPKTLSGKKDGWNREHLWPRAYGLVRGAPEFSDLHNLRPSDMNVNSARGKKYYGECKQDTKDKCMVPANKEAALDTATNRKIWMPPSKVRGDIARAIMYMAVRYGTGDLDSESGFELSDAPNAGLGRMGVLSVLLHWNVIDPPSLEEIVRNSRVCTIYQHNRNPFVDHPEFAEIIWGEPERKEHVQHEK